MNEDHLYGEEMNKILGKNKKKKGSSEKMKGSGLPDPQCHMMLKMMDSKIDMVAIRFNEDFDNRTLYGNKPIKG